MKTILKPTIILALLLLLLAACTGSTDTAENPASGAVPTSDTADNGATPQQADDKAQLNEDYTDAVPASTQLIIGSLQLEETDQAIDEDQAAKILPLWQAYQALSNADTTADAELQAVVNQIQGVMNPEQIQAVAALQVTSESAQAIMQEQGIGIGRGFGGGGAEGGTGEGGFRPGGGRSDGALPGGGGPGGGPGGLPGGFTDMSEEEREAAIAERFGGDNASAFLERGLLFALIRNLQVKTGEIDAEQAAPGGRVTGRFADTVAEASGIDAETLQAALEEGKSYAEAIAENGGDLEAAKEALQAFFAERGLEGDALEQRVDGFLNGAN